MARRKRRKRKTSVIGALIVEGLAVIAFIALFAHARAQRQQEMAGEIPTGSVAAWPSMLEETPFENVLGFQNIDQPYAHRIGQKSVNGPGSFLGRLTNFD